MTLIAPARAYRNHHLDNGRWRAIRTRPGDIVVATPYKCGTTWTQTIILHLLHQDLQPRGLREHSPWIEFRGDALDDLTARVEALPGRRCLKSHMPFDGAPFDPALRYVVVGRDPRDVFMSLWNHYSNYTDAVYAQLNDDPPGAPLPPCPADIRAFWAQWIGRGWFDWEVEGYPFWGNMRHVQSWWEQRAHPAITFVHYNDLLTQPEREIARLAAALDIACDAATVAAIAQATSFASMKRDAAALVGHNAQTFHGGAETFINKGLNGRWRAVLTDADLALYDAKAAAVLTPDCRAWLEQGGPA